MPYIHLKIRNNRFLKFLIDTGSNKSFINPSLIETNRIKPIKPIEIKTAFNTHIIDQQITINGLAEFKTNEPIQFLLFNFHNYFDGLIGLELLQQLKIKLDFNNSTLEIRDGTQIPLMFKPNFMSTIYTVPPQNKIIAHLPVDIENGDIHIKPLEINRNLLIPEGIYQSKNWYSFIEVTNYSDEPQNFVIEQPIKVERLDSNQFSEIHNFSIKSEIENPSDIDIIELIRIDHMNLEEKITIQKICKKFEDLFYREEQNLTFTNNIKHEINTKDDVPIYTRSYRYPEIHKEEIKNQIEKMLNQGIIRSSFSPWSSPIWIVPKKSDASGKKKWRLVVDYRKLNEKTIDDRYPIPNISEILDKLGKCIYFSTLDLASGFHQIEVKPQDIPKTAFSVDNGHYEYIRMPFGLKNAPATFQRVMDNVLRDIQGKHCLCYMDDIIVFSTSLQEHIESLTKVFQRLRNANLKIQLDKSEFLRKEIAFLGHIVTPNGVKPNPNKIKAIKDFPLPRTEKQIKSFLGLLGYYRKFIKDFAKLTKPFTECLRKDKRIILDSRYIETFETCKNLLINDPILQYPDFSKTFNLTTDASNFALGAILSQGPIGSDKPVCFASRTLTKSEQNYSTIEKELLAIVWATKYYRPYLYGRKFKIITDHKPLTWLFSLKEPNSKLIRWRLKLEEFDYEIIYKKGNLNTNADALSRIELNINESVENNIDEPENSEFASAIQTTEEIPNDVIPISERPINEFTNQLILEKNNMINKTEIIFKIIFKNKRRHTIRNKNIDEQKIIEILKSYLVPKRTTAILTDDDTFQIVQSVYSKYFSNHKFKLVRCKHLVKDIIDTDIQEKLIRDYHSSSNHRGISESLLHLKRDYYFPKERNLSQQYLLIL